MALGCRGKSVRKVGVDKSMKSGESDDAGVFDLGWTQVLRAVPGWALRGSGSVGSRRRCVAQTNHPAKLHLHIYVSIYMSAVSHKLELK
jgi:hypothetical protein